MTYSIILPVYNEQENIQNMYGRVSPVMRRLGTHEIIFVNDGSDDATLHLLKQLHAKDSSVKVISFSRNFGHQAAVSAGLNMCTGEKIAILDGDLQDPPEVLPTFFEKLDEGYDAVYAIRTKRKEGIFKRFAYSAFYRMLKSIANIDIPLDSGDFCVLDRKIVNAINSLPERNRFIRGIRSWVGFKQIGITYARGARAAGESKFTMKKLFKLAFDGIFSFSYVPLQAMFYVGLMALFFSLAGTIWAIYQKFFTTNYAEVPGFATTIILVLFVGGLQLFSLGVVGEYMRRMFDEIKQRPQYIIDEVVGV